MLLMNELDLSGKRVLIREDLNVPIQNGKITNEARINAALPSLQSALKQGAKVIVISHLGRPTEGEFQQEFSLQPVADRLSERLHQPVRLVSDWQNGIEMHEGDIVLLENVRMNIGEKTNDPTLAKSYANLCDVFVMDAFATAHRAHASTEGVIAFAPIACAGPLLSAEIKALNAAMQNPKKPTVAIVGGSKVSTKLSLLNNLINHVDQLIVGGGIANTFLAAKGVSIGQSLVETDLIDTAKQLLNQAEKKGASIPLPTDVVVATEFSDQAEAIVKPVNAINADEMILDIGPETAKQLAMQLNNAGTIIWNGPVGVFEIPQFSKGTKQIGQAVASSAAFSLAGGGDTIAAIDQFNLSKDISYISTGGGALLECLQGEKLPAIEALIHHNKSRSQHV